MIYHTKKLDYSTKIMKHLPLGIFIGQIDKSQIFVFQ